AGSAGVDVETTEDVTLWDTSIQYVPSNAQGPLGGGLSALLLGRSLTTRQGIFVLPGVIDADFTGQIKIMVWTPAPPVTILSGSRIAQLIPFVAQVPKAMPQVRGDSGFGSTGSAAIYWALDVGHKRPTVLVTFRHPHAMPNEWSCEMLADTGADVTIIS
ncbi:POK9 protein, partial [Bucorvus abyssinicus]|nr:POK9 protein [Bucorvus abyssinicus]